MGENIVQYQNVLKMPEVRVKKGRFLFLKVQYHVENVLASIMSDTPLMKNIVQKNASRLTTGKIIKIIIITTKYIEKWP